MRILLEIVELEECIQVIDWNIDQIAAGAPKEYSYHQQMKLKANHLGNIAKLRKELDAL
jgi:hypothetical protein